MLNAQGNFVIWEARVPHSVSVSDNHDAPDEVVVCVLRVSEMTEQSLPKLRTQLSNPGRDCCAVDIGDP